MNTQSFIISNKQMELDLQLVSYDLWATKVHVLMLKKQGIIKEKVAGKILAALSGIEKEYHEGKFTINPEKGLHLTIEAKVVEKIGEEGYFMHTARSRNDQVATAEMLYLREKALSVSHKLLKLLKLLIGQTEKNIETIMPGYTHMQPAKPTTFGQWCLLYFDMLSKCLGSLRYVYEKYDLSPLGSVESYGTSWKIDRIYTAKLLGFKKVWEIPLEAISSRGFFQLGLLGVLKDIGIAMGKMAADLLLFTTFEFDYVHLSSTTAKQMSPATGSSVMPQKKNPDVLELVRSTTPQLIGYENIVANLLSGLPMGYNRDTREVKEYMELGVSKTEEVISSFTSLLGTMKLNKEKMLQSVVVNFSLSTDLADYIAQKSGLPYRKVYKIVGLLVKEMKEKGQSFSALTADEFNVQAVLLGISYKLTDSQFKEAIDPVRAVIERVHIGGSNPKVMEKMIEERKKLIDKEASWLTGKKEIIQKAKEQTEKDITGHSRESGNLYRFSIRSRMTRSGYEAT